MGGWQCGASPRSTLRSASADLQHAQGERPLPGMDSRQRRIFDLPTETAPPNADVPPRVQGIGMAGELA